MALKFNVIPLCIFAVWGCVIQLMSGDAAIPVLEPPIVPDRHGLHGGSKTRSRLNIVTLVYDKAFRV